METGAGWGGGWGSKRPLASGWCMRSSGSVQSEARSSLTQPSSGNRRQQARKQAEAAQKFAEVAVEKGTSSNIFPHM